ncbi:hypothetical protein PybrP1_011059 [[Pythium] brassicae (nom. inval.)]|nr:hypothetical protein PybrP1_011059 [[Pythium] brassicae (nom. inval.)]
MPDAFAAAAARVAVVGQARRPLDIIRGRRRLSTADTAVVVVFDLTRKESLEAALAQWAFVASGDSGANRVLLVGTKLDLSHEREVFYAEALEVAEMHFGGAYAEVGVAHPPFVGVEAVERLLSEWTCAGAGSTGVVEQFPALSPESRSPAARDSAASPRRRPCVHASVWLYDPTEEQPPSPGYDVKLRPISRALFEIRGAGQEKRQSIAKFKEREVGKLMQRSKYYGPTESSRHMRWQEEQRRLKLAQSSPAAAASAHSNRPRSASHGAISSRSPSCDRRRESEQLAAKSFAQSTELLRQRKLELMARKALAAASATLGSSRPHGTRALADPQAARDAAQKQKRTRKFAGTALSSVPEEDRGAAAADAVSPPRSPTRGLAADDAMDLLVGSPGAAHDDVRERRATITDTPSSYSRSALQAADSVDASAATSCLCDEPPSGADARSAADELPSKVDAASAPPEEAAPADALAFTCDIDDMLDYFDGVTLPI